jgi:uncharacterized cupin superfamily protein
MSMYDSQNVKACRTRPVDVSVVEKLPIKRQNLHKTTNSSLDILEHSPGEFDWCTQADLTAWVISGSAEVLLDDGRDVVLQPGNALFLPRGLHGRWIVKESLKTAVVFND